MIWFFISHLLMVFFIFSILSFINIVLYYVIIDNYYIIFLYNYIIVYILKNNFSCDFIFLFFLYFKIIFHVWNKFLFHISTLLIFIILRYLFSILTLFYHFICIIFKTNIPYFLVLFYFSFLSTTLFAIKYSSILLLFWTLFRHESYEN